MARNSMPGSKAGKAGRWSAVIGVVIMSIANAMGEPYSSTTYLACIMGLVALGLRSLFGRLMPPKSGRLISVAAMQSTMLLLVLYAVFYSESVRLWVSAVVLAISAVWLVVSPGTGSMICAGVYLVLTISNQVLGFIDAQTVPVQAFLSLCWYLATGWMLFCAVRERNAATGETGYANTPDRTQETS